MAPCAICPPRSHLALVQPRARPARQVEAPSPAAGAPMRRTSCMLLLLAASRTTSLGGLRQAARREVVRRAGADVRASVPEVRAIRAPFGTRDWGHVRVRRCALATARTRSPSAEGATKCPVGPAARTARAHASTTGQTACRYCRRLSCSSSERRKLAVAVAAVVVVVGAADVVLRGYLCSRSYLIAMRQGCPSHAHVLRTVGSASGGGGRRRMPAHRGHPYRFPVKTERQELRVENAP